MIKSIEIWDFESHEHTLLDNLSAGFNLIFGESNAGKTSILRAVKLVAYNEFDPKSVRVGKKSCSVQVITDKGRVKVTKPSNEWEIEALGKPTEYYEKIGKAILPEAAEIVGLSMVQLGDIEMPVNVMNQLEGHFMLSELNGKVASGSARAQIIDEISGLSGIETVIKEVSLDNHRWGRDVKQAEERIEELAKQLYDPKELAKEGALLDSVKKSLTDRDDCTAIVRTIDTLCGKVIDTGDLVEELDKELKALPDPATIEPYLNTALLNNNIGDAATVVSDAWTEAKRKASAIEDELATTVDTAGAQSSLDAAKKAFDGVASLRAMHKGVEDAKLVIETSDKDLITTANELADAEVERDKILESITVCPLTQLPFSGAGCGGAHASIALLADPEPEPECPEPEQECPESEPEELDDENDGLFDDW